MEPHVVDAFLVFCVIEVALGLRAAVGLEQGPKTADQSAQAEGGRRC